MIGCHFKIQVHTWLPHIRYGCQIHETNEYKSPSYHMMVIYCIFFIFHPFSLYKSKHNTSRHSIFQNKLVGQADGLSLMLWDCASVHIGPESLNHLHVAAALLQPAASPLICGPVRVLVRYRTVQALNTGKRQVPFVKLLQKRGEQSFV